jgi:hypothetical protein
VTLEWKGTPVYSRERIGTWRGHLIDPFDLDATLVDIVDIAHSLARLCRYNGHTEGHYSVARHSILVAGRLAATGHPRDVQLAGLLHDAAEAYLGDMTSPLKRRPEMAPYRDAEDRAQKVIAGVFGLPHPLPDVVYDADTLVALEREMPYPHGLAHAYWGEACDDEFEFLACYHDLTRTMPEVPSDPDRDDP